MLDMEERFKSGEIRCLNDFIRILDSGKNDKARIRVFEKYAIFEMAMNFRLSEAEANLKRR